MQTAAAGQLFEVLAEAPNGHRTVYRVNAARVAAARDAVTGTLDPGVRVLGAAPAGQGLGSGDSPQ